MHISCILLDRNPNLVSKCILRRGSVTHTILGHCDLDLWPSFKSFCVRSTSLIFFAVGIPNLECICILGWWSLTYYFLATVTLTSDLVLIIIVSGAYLLNYLRRESQIWCVNASWDGWVSCTIFGHCDLDHWPSFNNNCVRSISLLLFEIGIPNLVCECILGWWSVLYHLQVTVTLTSGLIFRKIMSRAYLLYY